MRRARKLLLALAAIIVIVFLVVPMGIAYAGLHPARCPHTGTPGDYGLSYEEFEVTTPDGVVLKGWIVEPQGEAKPVVFIVMHGYTSCKADPRLLELVRGLAGRGYTVVAFDFRGHGESGGTTTIGPLEASYDVPTIISFVEDRFPDYDIVLLGYSMGAVAGIMAGASYEGPHRLVIVADSPYPVLAVVVPRWLKSQMGVPEWYGSIVAKMGGLLSGQDLGFGPMSLDEINKPLLVIAGDRDPLVTPEEARAIAAKSCCGEALIVEGAAHVEAAKVMGLDNYLDTIESFVNSNLSK